MVICWKDFLNGLVTPPLLLPFNGNSRKQSRTSEGFLMSRISSRSVNLLHFECSRSMTCSPIIQAVPLN